MCPVVRLNLRVPWLGGDLRLYGEEGEGGVHPGADEAVHRGQGLHPHPDHQQKDKHQVLPRRRLRGMLRHSWLQLMTGTEALR